MKCVARVRCGGDSLSAAPSAPGPHRASIVTASEPFGRWGEIFGDATVAAAMIDRLVHDAEVVSLKGDSYLLKDRDLGGMPTDDAA